jgi:hypothetical protein
MTRHLALLGLSSLSLVLIGACGGVESSTTNNPPPVRVTEVPAGDAAAEGDGSQAQNDSGAASDGGSADAADQDACTDAAMDPQCPLTWSCNSGFGGVSNAGPCQNVGQRCRYGCGPAATTLVCSPAQDAGFGLIGGGGPQWTCSI